MTELRIADLSELGEGQTLKFQFKRGTKTLEGFVARFKGQVVAYENLCRHIPLTLDYADNRFFNKDGTHFVCQTHGAVYEPLSGLCVQGPCEGANLKRLTVELRGGAVWLKE